MSDTTYHVTSLCVSDATQQAAEEHNFVEFHLMHLRPFLFVASVAYGVLVASNQLQKQHLTA